MLIKLEVVVLIVVEMNRMSVEIRIMVFFLKIFVIGMRNIFLNFNRRILYYFFC